jgi:hypothetical protein
MPNLQCVAEKDAVWVGGVFSAAAPDEISNHLPLPSPGAETGHEVQTSVKQPENVQVHRKFNSPKSSS